MSNPEDENAECVCGHLAEYHDENGWCDQTSCVCAFYDPIDEYEEAGLQIVDHPDEEYTDDGL